MLSEQELDRLAAIQQAVADQRDGIADPIDHRTYINDVGWLLDHIEAQEEALGHARETARLLIRATEQLEQTQAEAAVLRQALGEIVEATEWRWHRGDVSQLQADIKELVPPALPGTAGQALLDELTRLRGEVARLAPFRGVGAPTHDVDRFYLDEPVPDELTCLRAVAEAAEIALVECQGHLRQVQAEIAAMRLLPDDPALMEQLAGLEHERWSGWMKYQAEHCYLAGIERYDRHRSGEAFVTRWQRLAKTLYENLTEQEKESDRIEVRKTLAVLTAALSGTAGQALLEELARLQAVAEAALECRQVQEERTSQQIYWFEAEGESLPSAAVDAYLQRRGDKQDALDGALKAAGYPKEE